jgi:hypothetical protein
VRKQIIILIGLLLFFGSCRKTINKTNPELVGAWINVGHIEVAKNSSATQEVYFYSDHGDFIIVVDECLEEHDIE